jgi:3-hydroxybutyryl-CoA dehydrogenase
VSDIARVGVIGCGLMGSGIVEVCARSGLDVRVFEVSAPALAAGQARVAASLGRARDKAKISSEEYDAAIARISYTLALEDFADRDLTIEAIIEREQDKVELFARLDQIVTRPDAILATNTSSIPVVNIAVATQRPAQVIGLHFFNPAPVQQLVELVPSILTDESVLERAQALVVDVFGKTPIRAPDQAGFVVNALLIPFILSAIRLVEAGHASAADIDTGMTLGCAHPMGPLRLADLVGLDTVKAVGDSMYAEFKEPLYAPPPLLLRMVAAGRYGKKAGRGFYSYES